MTEDQILEELKNLADSRDFENAHLQADGLLIELLRLLGKDEIADAYDKVGKWYA